MSQIRRIKDMRLAKKETAVVTSPVKKVTLVDKEEVGMNVGHWASYKVHVYRFVFDVIPSCPCMDLTLHLVVYHFLYVCVFHVKFSSSTFIVNVVNMEKILCLKCALTLKRLGSEHMFLAYAKLFQLVFFSATFKCSQQLSKLYYFICFKCVVIKRCKAGLTQGQSHFTATFDFSDSTMFVPSRRSRMQLN